MDIVTKAKKVIEIEIQTLRQMQRRIDGDFTVAIGLLLNALAQRHKIIVTGVGKSGHIGHKISATLTSTGAPSVVLDTVNAVHGDLGVVTEGDVLIALSYSGETEEMVRILPVLRRMNVAIIALTGNLKSTLAKNSKAVLDVSVRKEACPLNLAPTSSTTAMLAVGDALAMVLLEKRGFKKEDFAKFHPGGTLGKNLLIKVCDVMRPKSDLVILPGTAQVRAALKLWNVKRAGAAVITDKLGRVIGIFTHGDFVRRFEQNPNIGTTTLEKVMTPKPITVRVDKLAVEVLNLFQNYRIDDLVVVDEKRRPVGLVDAQDLTKHKLL